MTRFLVLIAMLGAVVVPSHPSEPILDPSSSASSRTQIQESIRFRLEHGFSAEPELVASLLVERPSSVYGPGLSVDEVADLQSRADLRDRLNPALSFIAVHPSEFGGTYFDQSSGQLRLIVRTVPTTTAATQDELHGLLPVDAIVDFRQAQFSQDKLEAVRDDLVAEYMDGPATFAYVDPIANVVRLNVGANRLLQAEVSLRNRPDVVVALSDGPVAADACSSRTACTAPWRGGTYLSGCTWGFNARPTGSSSTRYVLSAGHCSHLGDNRIHNGTIVNTSVGVDRNSFDLSGTVSADAMRAPLKSFSGSKNLIYDSNYTKSHAITSFELTANQTVGETIAMSGISGGYVYGTISAVNIYAQCNRGSNTKMVYLMRASFNSLPGDSGAPIYWGPKAYGLDHGHLSGDNRALYSTIGRVNADMNSRLCLNSSCS
jgi:hypothetical protein